MDPDSNKYQENPLTAAMPRPSGAGLAWDPAADFGFVGDSFVRASTSSTERNSSTSQDQDNVNPNSHAYRIAFVTPPSGSEDLQRETSSGSLLDDVRKAKLYSTPSASPPVPLESLQYSPVLPDPPDAGGDHVRKSHHQVVVNDVTLSSARVYDSSDENINEDLTEEKRTSRQVSEASTEWEYDKKKKHTTSNSLSDWQTSGVTRSEIEYKNRKNSGTSSSGGSIFLLQVEASMKAQNEGSAPKKENIPPPRRNVALSPIKFNEFSSAGRETSTSNDYDRHRSKAKGKKHHHHRQLDTDDEYPSTMCRIVQDVVKNLQENSAKDNETYDVLKTHRTYHVLKMRKQLATLEKLNREIASFKATRKPKALKRYTSYVYEDENGKKSITVHPESDDERKQDEDVGFKTPKARKSRASTADYKKEQFKAKDSLRSEDERKDEPQYRVRKGSSSASSKTRELSKGKNLQVSDDDRTSDDHYRVRKSGSSTSSKTKEYSSMPIGRVNTGFLSSSEERSLEAIKKEKRKPTKEKPKPVGFYVAMLSSEAETDDDRGREEKPSRNWIEKKRTTVGYYDCKGLKNLEDCFKENNPQCYQSVKERDDCLLTRKWDRQVSNETVLKEVLEAEMPEEEIEKYLERFLEHARDEDENRRLMKYWDLYQQAQKYKKCHDGAYAVSTKEMKERTARLRLRDPVVLNKQKKETEERRKLARRDQQRNFSDNLRRFQKMGNINVPDRLHLAGAR